MENIYTVLITVVSTLGGTAAWRFYERRASAKEADEHFLRNDCQTRILKLEMLLEESSREKDALRGEILRLTEEVSALRTEIRILHEKSRNGL